jgi:hypothetical protein
MSFLRGVTSCDCDLDRTDNEVRALLNTITITIAPQATGQQVIPSCQVHARNLNFNNLSNRDGPDRTMRLGCGTGRESSAVQIRVHSISSR